MSLDAWGKQDEADRDRTQRLLGSYAAASALVAGLLIVGVVFGGQIKQQVLEEEREVKLAPPEKKPELPKPPPPPPPPEVKRKAASQGPPPPLGPKLSAPPSEIPREKPREDDPSRAAAEVAYGEGDPNGCVGCTGKPGGGGGPPADAASAPPAPPTRPYQIAEVTTPPVAIAKTTPAYPEEARKQGVDTVVVVQFVVTETGDVENVKVLSGHPTLDEVVIAAVKAWRFTPGTLDGRPVRVARKMKFPFHLRTAN